MNNNFRPLKASEHLKILLDRPQTPPGGYSSGRIELVGTRFGKVAAGIFPNGILQTVQLAVIDEDSQLLTTHTTFTRSDGLPYSDTNVRTAHAVFGEQAQGVGGIDQWPLLRRERRHEMADLREALGKLAQSGSSYDPFQRTELIGHAILAVESSADIHPAVHDAVAPFRK